eukprot:4044805-Heterocapsa_arctica.AAC.1
MARGLPDGPVPPNTYMFDFDVDFQISMSISISVYGPPRSPPCRTRSSRRPGGDPVGAGSQRAAEAAGE